MTDKAIDAAVEAIYLKASLIRATARIERLEAALRDVLARDAESAPSGRPDDCNCINLSRDGEREYETGTCPHQIARAALKGETP
jgi:hypothetical protein